MLDKVSFRDEGRKTKPKGRGFRVLHDQNILRKLVGPCQTGKIVVENKPCPHVCEDSQGAASGYHDAPFKVQGVQAPERMMIDNSRVKDSCGVHIFDVPVSFAQT